MKINLLLYIGFLCAIFQFNLLAQQDPQLSQYMHNKTFINPAAAGSNGGNISLFYRNQWVNMPGSPKSFGAIADIGFKSGVGLGINIFNSTQGPLAFTRVLTNYSYKIKINENNTNLYLGLQAGILQYSIDTKDLETYHEISKDPTLNSGNLRKMVPDFGFGAMVKSKSFYAGIAVPHLLQPKIKFFNEVEASDSIVSNPGVKTNFARIFRHYYFTAGGDIIINPTVTLQPSLLLKLIENSALSADINLNALLLEKFWGGIGYRTGTPGAVAFMAGIIVKTFKFGYAYELTKSPVASFGGATHELMISYQFANVPEAKQSKKPYFMK